MSDELSEDAIETMAMITQAAVSQAVAATFEECAKIAEDIAAKETVEEKHWRKHDIESASAYEASAETARDIAAAIRAAASARKNPGVTGADQS